MIRAALLVAVVAAPLAAETLEGRDVLFRVETWDDRTAPIFVTRDYIATVGPGPEFTIAAESANGLVAIPVKVDISAGRIDLSYAQTEPGGFAVAAFNGYVLTFLADCVLFEGAKIDPEVTTLPILAEDVIVEADALLINVSDQIRDRDSHIGIILDVTDCPVS